MRIHADELGIDAACDHMAADDASWARGRGWALCTGIVALPYYVETNPTWPPNARIDEVLADFGS